MDGASKYLQSRLPKVGGDFNVIRRFDEKLGGARLTLNMRYFDELIGDLELFDPPLEMLLLLCQICKIFLFVRDWQSGIVSSLLVSMKLYQDGLLITTQFVWIPIL